MLTPHIGSHARSGTRSGLVAGCVLVAAAGDLFLLPLMSVRLASPTLLLLAVLGLFQVRHVLPRLRSEGLAASLRSAPTAWSFGLFILVMLAWVPLAYTRSPDPTQARAELTGVITGVLLAAGTAAATRYTAGGLRSMRLGWVIGLVLALGTAVFEIATGRHVHADESLSWTLDPTIVAGPFRNPNDFAAILAVLVSGTIAYRAGVRSARARAGLAVLAAFGVVAVFLTQSRGGLIAIVLVLAIHAVRVLADRRDAGRVPTPRSSRGPRTVTWAIAGAALVAVVAAFTVPALARHNPIVTMITAAGQPGTARSDTLRLDLIRAGWRYFTGSDHLGTGAGSFEYLLAHDPNPGVSHIIWMHNTFLELLLQYGIVVAAALVAVVVAVLVTSARSLLHVRGKTAEQRRETRMTVAEALSALVAFAALGSLAYTALETHAWWMLLAYAVVAASTLTARHTRPKIGSEATASVPADDGSSEVTTRGMQFVGPVPRSRR